MNLSTEDFGRLFTTAAQCDRGGIRTLAHRLEPMPCSLDWNWIYWFDSYAALLLARQFIEDLHWVTETAFDDGCEEWVLVTNYEWESEVQDEEDSICEGCRAALEKGSAKGRIRRQDGV